jgi:hypothetical protein
MVIIIIIVVALVQAGKQMLFAMDKTDDRHPFVHTEGLPELSSKEAFPYPFASLSEKLKNKLSLIVNVRILATLPRIE